MMKKGLRQEVKGETGLVKEQVEGEGAGEIKLGEKKEDDKSEIMIIYYPLE